MVTSEEGYVSIITAQCCVCVMKKKEYSFSSMLLAF